MTLFVVNVVLALLWGAVTGSFVPLNLVFGFVLGSLALFVIREQSGTVGYLSRARKIFVLFVLFLRELLLSAFRVATLVLNPKMDLHPGIFAFSLTVDRDEEIALLANLITLTPGTLSVDVSDDRKTLYIHAIDCRDVEAACAEIANGFERRILEAFR